MSNQPKKTILVVDDEPRMIRFVKMNLDLEGYLTLEANNGYQALEKVRDHQPDLVLLDVEMPGMDGFETLRRIREISETPVIMLTVRSDEDDRIGGSIWGRTIILPSRSAHASCRAASAPSCAALSNMAGLKTRSSLSTTGCRWICSDDK